MKSMLFVASECIPYVKSGGLADVMGSLPKSLVKRGYDVRVVIPMYMKIAKKYSDDFDKLCKFDVNIGKIHTVATVYGTKADGVTYYFIQHAGYFERDALYGYPDDGERFSFFQAAVLEMLKPLEFFPDIMHCHDWHTGMISAMCKIHYAFDEKYTEIKHVYTIHNLAFQGNFPKSVLSDCLGFPEQYYYDGSMRFHDGGISFMKSAIVFSDKITTVSPTYSNEILTPDMGENLDEILRYRRYDLWGITNGIDTDIWNPKTDDIIQKNYHPAAYKAGKRACKKALQEELGLRVSKDTIVLGMVSRLTYQKGVYLLLEKMYEILGLDVQLVILGTGETNVENAFKDMENKFKRRAVYYCGYNEELAHKVYAGCDVLLMPSLFEPCGISQLIAMRYGTLPLVRETGGLKDTVQPYNMYTKEGNGFSFHPFNAHDFWFTIKSAVDTYYLDKEAWNSLIQNALETDVSFERSTDLYEELYSSMD
jgi:starch synthase